MLRLVSSKREALARHLASAPFSGIEIDHAEADSADSLRALVRTTHAHVAIVGADFDGGRGVDLAAEIAHDPELAETRVIVELPERIDRDLLSRIAASGCDDVLAPPVDSDEFYYHVAQLTGLPIRRDRRVGVSLDLSLPDLGATMRGAVRNVTTRGVGVELDTPLEKGMVVLLRFSHDGQDYPDAPARVAWVHESDGAHTAGLSFDRTPPVATLILLEQLSLYDISRPAPHSPMAGAISVALQGDFTEISDFSQLQRRLAGERQIDFNAAAVRYISSAGVRAWCEFLQRLTDQAYGFRHLSLAFASQASMVPMVLGEGAVRSVEAPYLCETCDREELRLVETRSVVCDDDGIAAPVLTCSTCRSALELDDLPERYFAFLIPASE